MYTPLLELMGGLGGLQMHGMAPAHCRGRAVDVRGRHEQDSDSRAGHEPRRRLVRDIAHGTQHEMGRCVWDEG